MSMSGDSTNSNNVFGICDGNWTTPARWSSPSIASHATVRVTFFVRELVLTGEIEVRWIDTKFNLSDLLSKGTLDGAQHDALKVGPMGKGVAD